MALVNPQPLIGHCAQSFDEVKKALLSLGHVKKESISTEKESVWFYVGQLLEAFATEQEAPDSFALLQSEQKVISLMSIPLLNDWKNKKTKENEVELLKQLQFICAYIGITFKPVFSYSLPDFIQNFWQKKKPFDVLKAIRSFKELGRDEDAKEFCGYLVEMLKKNELFQKAEYSWEEVFWMMLIGHTLYAKFPLLSDQARADALKNFFARAIMIGAPVKQALQDVVYKTYTPMGYVLETSFLFEPLGQNTEDILFTPGAQKTFGNLVKDYVNVSGDDFDKPKKQEAFLKSMQYKDKGVAQVIGQALSLYVDLKTAKIVEQNRGAELSQAESYQNDVIELLYMFGIGEAGAEQIKKYFMAEHPRVPLASFLQILKETVDLKRDESVENVADFTAVLHESKLLPTTQELIVFDEKSGQFRWNT